MKKVKILDCTLRDGGYCNEWRFGFDQSIKIVNSLTESGVDIVECGFLTRKVVYDPDVTKYTSVQQIAERIPADRQGKLFVAMVNYGEYDAKELPCCDGTSIDGIRVAFHKKDVTKALEFCKAVAQKGYKVFVQAMVSLSYTDAEFQTLVENVNDFCPYAFYIVDSFGSMKRTDLLRLMGIVERNLDDRICVGFHSHNNMQLAYANAQALIDLQPKHELIIDSSVYGMGRGAGNLNTELLVEYLNEYAEGQYILKPLLNIIDEVLSEFYWRNRWGFSLPNYLSAAHNVHPNYAGYLDDKKTLTVNDMNEIFLRMDEAEKVSYNKSYIEGLYLEYMAKGEKANPDQSEKPDLFAGKSVLLIAPGKSSVEQQEKIAEYSAQKDVISVSINFDYSGCLVDYIFLSNLRRFRELDEELYSKCIVTSNIPVDHAFLQVKYQELLADEEAVADNAGLMALKFFVDCGVKSIYLAGFDGYSHDSNENYGDSHRAYDSKSAVLDAINLGMSNVLRSYKGKVELQFLTDPKYVTIM